MKNATPILLSLLSLASLDCSPRETKGPPVDTSKLPGLTSCLPGQVNDKGVGRICTRRDDCAGLWASFCDVSISKKRPPMCTRLCDDDTDCGPNAMCGIVNGTRHCYPSVCKAYTYTPGCERTDPNCIEVDRSGKPEIVAEGEQPTHLGAVACVGGFAFNTEGYGRRCDPGEHDFQGGTCKGQRARACEATFNPTGPDWCNRECRREGSCGEFAYCGYHYPLKSFNICYPRCPEPAHRAMRAQPPSLDRCSGDRETVPAGNALGVGMRCAKDADCATNSGAKSCGSTLADTTRKPDVCTLRCLQDADCGRNAVCTDVDFNLAGDGKASGHPRYCVPACWAL